MGICPEILEGLWSLIIKEQTFRKLGLTQKYSLGGEQLLCQGTFVGIVLEIYMNHWYMNNMPWQ